MACKLYGGHPSRLNILSMGNNNGKRIIYFLLATLALACVKDPQDIPGNPAMDPAFKLEGSIGNTPVILQAGVDEWTAQPAVKEEASNIVYTTLFSIDGCLQACAPSVEFRFYRSLPANEQPDIDFLQTLQPGVKEFVRSGQEQDSFEITVATHPGLFMNGFSSWEDFNGSGITYASEFNTTIGYQQDVNVCFQSFAYTGCQYQQCIIFDPSTLIPCLSYIEPKIENPRFVNLALRLQGTPPFDIEWFNGYKTASILLPIPDSATIYASVVVTDANQNRSELNQTIRLDNGFVDPCYFPIDVTSVPLITTAPELFADKVEIIYRDANGEIWSSSAGIQDQASMNIASVSYFDLSPLDEPAYKVDLTFSVTLFNEETGEGRLFVSGGSSIPLSHR